MQAGRADAHGKSMEGQQQPWTVTLEDAREAARAILLPSEAAGSALVPL